MEHGVCVYRPMSTVLVSWEAGEKQSHKFKALIWNGNVVRRKKLLFGLWLYKKAEKKLSQGCIELENQSI